MPHPHDNWAEYYDCVYQRTYGNFYHNFTELTIDAIQQIIKQGVILDLGAGTGRLSIPLSKLGYHVIAVESSKAMCEIILRKAQQEGVKIEVLNKDIASYKHTKADLAIALFTVLSYATSEAQLRAMIENIKSYLNPQGFFFFDLPGHLFFNNPNLLSLHNHDINRDITLSKTAQPEIYNYHEVCSGTCCTNEPFAYETSFYIRYWKENYVIGLLEEYGFKNTGRQFHQFSATGATYYLFQLTA